MARSAEQVSISLPPDLIDWLDRKAADQGTSRSGTLARLLEERRRQEWEELFAEGCRELADEMLDQAARSQAAQAEVALAETFDADPPR